MTPAATRAIGVAGTDAVLLGPEVTCDGFHIDRPVRIQTHWHQDHMAGFGSSKRGEIAMSPETFELLSLSHPDLRVRANVHVLQPGEEGAVFGQSVLLERSTHCLGAVQAAVRVTDGRWIGYSGDFSWPLDAVIQVDELVVDATYGQPGRDRSYSQADAQDSLVNYVRRHLREGPIHIFAQGGTMERALAVLEQAGVLQDLPVVGSARFCMAVDVHRKAGYLVPRVTDLDSAQGLEVLRDGSYIRCWALREQMPNDVVAGTSIQLTKYRTFAVVEELAARSFRIGFSNHADFDGTMAYIARTGARYVLTDGSRTSPGKARALAAAVSRELGIIAQAAIPDVSLEYGR